MANAGRPNVLLLLCDQQPWNALGCYHNREVRTPLLDRLATQGCTFTHCFAQHISGPECAASLLAGKYPARLSAGSPPGSWLLLPRVLRGYGYRTAAFGAIPIAHAPDGVFDHLELSEGFSAADSYQAFVRANSPEHLAALEQLNTEPAREHLLPPDLTVNSFVTARSIGLLRQSSRAGQPFCLAAGFRAFASPRVMPQCYMEPYDPHTIMPFHPTEMSASRKLTTEQLRLLTQAYYATVSEIDGCCGLLLQELEKLQLAHHTVVVYAGIRGFHVDPRIVMHDGAAVPDGVVHVPLIVRGPAELVQAGIVCNSSVESVDIAPTLLELLAVPKPGGMQGESFRAVLAGESQQHRDSGLIELPDRVVLRTQYFQYAVCHNGREAIYDLSQPSGHLADVSGELRYRGAVMEHRHRLITRVIRANYL